MAYAKFFTLLVALCVVQTYATKTWVDTSKFVSKQNTPGWQGFSSGSKLSILRSSANDESNSVLASSSTSSSRVLSIHLRKLWGSALASVRELVSSKLSTLSHAEEIKSAVEAGRRKDECVGVRTTEREFYTKYHEDTTPRKAHWRDHPVLTAEPSIVPPILTWYHVRFRAEYERQVGAYGRYTFRGSKYNLLARRLRDTPEAKALRNYDLLQVGFTGVKGRENYLEFETSRASKMCLLMNVNDSSFDWNHGDGVMRPPVGYEAVGLAGWDDEFPRTRNHKHAAHTFEAFGGGYVACRFLSSGVHALPSPDLLGAEFNIRAYHILFAEVNGSAPELTPMPSGWTGPVIVQHELCPRKLHDMWVVENHDPSDPDTRGKKWRTWHPQKDYLYGCYYGHEHGTPGILAGYTERLDYTTWKNYRKNESDEGFKTYVVPVEDKYFVMNLHSDTKDIGRVNREFHTLVMAVTEKNTGKLLFEMACKASSGGSAADYKTKPATGTPFYTLGNNETRLLVDELYRYPGHLRRVNHRKRINLQNPNNWDSRLRYNSIPRRGLYEAWFMRAQGEMCAISEKPWRAAGPIVDIRNSHTGCLDRACTQKIVLGMPPRKVRSYFSPNLGTSRSLELYNMTIGKQFCTRKLPEPRPDGYIVFYTNPYCNKTCDGPGESCIMQRIHSSFTSLTIHGHYDVSDINGHYTYEPTFLDPAKKIKKGGLTGIGQVEGALSLSISEE